MAQILIRNLDEDTKRRLRERAARHGRSVEAEARDILTAAVRTKPVPQLPLGQRMVALFAPLGGVDLPDVRDRTPHEPKVTFEDFDEE